MNCKICKTQFENLQTYLAHVKGCLSKTTKKVQCAHCNMEEPENEMKKHLNDIHISKIFDNLYLADFQIASSKQILDEKKVTHILNVASEIKTFFPKDYKYLHLQLDDVCDQNISEHFLNAMKFLDDAMNSNGTILIHCAKGISRSAAFTIMYVMYKKKISYESAYEYVLSCRPIIEPNRAFVSQLKAWDKTNIQ